MLPWISGSSASRSSCSRPVLARGSSTISLLLMLSCQVRPWLRAHRTPFRHVAGQICVHFHSVDFDLAVAIDVNGDRSKLAEEIAVGVWLFHDLQEIVQLCSRVSRNNGIHIRRAEEQA